MKERRIFTEQTIRKGRRLAAATGAAGVGALAFALPASASETSAETAPIKAETAHTQIYTAIPRGEQLLTQKKIVLDTPQAPVVDGDGKPEFVQKKVKSGDTYSEIVFRQFRTYTGEKKIPEKTIESVVAISAAASNIPNADKIDIGQTVLLPDKDAVKMIAAAMGKKGAADVQKTVDILNKKIEQKGYNQAKKEAQDVVKSLEMPAVTIPSENIAPAASDLKNNLPDKVLREKTDISVKKGAFVQKTLEKDSIWDAVSQDMSTPAETNLISRMEVQATKHYTKLHAALDFDELTMKDHEPYVSIHPDVRVVLQGISGMKIQDMIDLKKTVSPEVFIDVWKLWSLNHRTGMGTIDEIASADRSGYEVVTKTTAHAIADKKNPQVEKLYADLKNADTSTKKAQVLMRDRNVLTTVFSDTAVSNPGDGGGVPKGNDNPRTSDNGNGIGRDDKDNEKKGVGTTMHAILTAVGEKMHAKDVGIVSVIAGVPLVTVWGRRRKRIKESRLQSERQVASGSLNPNFINTDTLEEEVSAIKKSAMTKHKENKWRLDHPNQIPPNEFWIKDKATYDEVIEMLGLVYHNEPQSRESALFDQEFPYIEEEYAELVAKGEEHTYAFVLNSRKLLGPEYDVRLVKYL